MAHLRFAQGRAVHAEGARRVTPSIYQIGTGYDVAALKEQLYARPDAWNRHRTRTYAGPHNEVSDVWVRYNASENLGPDFNNEHESVWYPVVDDIPAVSPLIFKVMHDVSGTRLGGVLITKIPPGGKVAPHSDHGWHARYYDKFAVQVCGNSQQAFCFEDAELRPEPGDLYTFDNSRLHWVNNDSDSDRITLIICIKK